MNTTAVKRAFTEAEAAEYIGVSRSSLRVGRMHGPREGHMPVPPYVRLGKSIRYLQDDLDAFLTEHRAKLPAAARR